MYLQLPQTSDSLALVHEPNANNEREIRLLARKRKRRLQESSSFNENDNVTSSQSRRKSLSTYKIREPLVALAEEEEKRNLSSMMRLKKQLASQTSTAGTALVQSTDLKNILKNTGGLSLVEILQQKNISLEDLLKGKKNALLALQSTTTPANNEKDSTTKYVKITSTKSSQHSSSSSTESTVENFSSLLDTPETLRDDDRDVSQSALLRNNSSSKNILLQNLIKRRPFMTSKVKNTTAIKAIVSTTTTTTTTKSTTKMYPAKKSRVHIRPRIKQMAMGDLSGGFWSIFEIGVLDYFCIKSTFLRI